MLKSSLFLIILIIISLILILISHFVKKENFIDLKSNNINYALLKDNDNNPKIVDLNDTNKYVRIDWTNIASFDKNGKIADAGFDLNGKRILMKLSNGNLGYFIMTSYNWDNKTMPLSYLSIRNEYNDNTSTAKFEFVFDANTDRPVQVPPYPRTWYPQNYEKIYQVKIEIFDMNNKLIYSRISPDYFDNNQFNFNIQLSDIEFKNLFSKTVTLCNPWGTVECPTKNGQFGCNEYVNCLAQNPGRSPCADDNGEQWYQKCL